LTLKAEDSVILITGGAKGLGLAMVHYFVERKARVAVVDLDEAGLAELPEGVTGHVLDVTSANDAATVVAAIEDEVGPITALVNNAGVIYSEPFVNIMNADGMMHDYARFRRSVQLNMDSVFIMTSAVVERMIRGRRHGAIVNISSISAGGNEGQTAYSAAKAGVNAMTVTWSKELGRWGIRCNAVAPGFIGTESTHHALSEAIVTHVRDNTPLRRLGEPHEVAQAVHALIENDFMNGVVLDVNGGLTI
jgi:3-oxoacyl-[acyl-carrier protein] reductase